MTGGTAFTIPANPGIYPTMLTANAAAGTRAIVEANIRSFKTNLRNLKVWSRD